MARDTRKKLSLPAPLTVRMLRRAAQSAENLPLAGEAVRRMQALEEWAVAELKQRMDALADAELFELRSRRADPDLPAALLADLLDDADKLTVEQARRQRYVLVLRQLCPDQAKMLSVLAAGRTQPLIHIGAGLPAAPVRHMVLENATSLGRSAGVTERDEVPSMVGHMRTLGLLDIGAEDDAFKTDYEILEADTVVREAMTYVKDTLRLWPRVQRHTVALSDFGRGLWEAAAPD